MVGSAKFATDPGTLLVKVTTLPTADPEENVVDVAPAVKRPPTVRDKVLPGVASL